MNMQFAMVKMILISQIIKRGKSYDFVCPSSTQWKFRANALCLAENIYACLLNRTYEKFDENCQGPDIADRGYKLVFQPKEFNLAPCLGERYQPIPFSTSGNSGCVFRKATCGEEGQVISNDMQLNSDVTCICDYTEGYTLVSHTSHPCYCNPLTEDCSCFKPDNRSSLESTSCWKYMIDECTKLPIQSNCPKHAKGIQYEKGNENMQMNFRRTCNGLVVAALCMLYFGLVFVMVAYRILLYVKYSHYTELQDPKSLEEKGGLVENMQAQALRGYKSKAEYEDDSTTTNTKDVQTNIKDQNKNIIQDWKKDDKKYVETNAYNHVLNCLETKNCVTVTGSPAVGKTATLRHIALFYAEKGYTIFPVVEPADVRNYYNPREKMMFVIDDLFGKSSASKLLITAWEQFSTVITNIIENGSCKIIVACRLQIYRDEMFNMLHHFRICDCNMVSQELKLTNEEKIKIAVSHIENYEELTTEVPDLDFFPLLCRICGENKEIDIAEFFAHPFQVLKTELDRFFNETNDENRFKLCALVLLVLHNNELKKCNLQSENVREQIENICYIYDLPTSSPTHRVQEALSTLKDTYVIEENDTYKLKHDMLFSFILHYFSISRNNKAMIGCLIKYSSMDMIHDRFVLYKENEDDRFMFMVIIPSEYHNSYFQRIFQDWLGGHLWSVLENVNTKQTQYRTNMIKHLKKLHRKPQKDLANMDIPTGNGERYTPLVWCCYHGYADILKWLASVGVDINQKVFLSGSWVSPLTIACARNKTNMILTLIDLEVRVNTIDSLDITPIYTACNIGNSENVELLLTNEADINIKGQYEVTPLLLACLKNEDSTVHLLLLHKANTDCCLRDQCSNPNESKIVDWLETTFPSFVNKYRQLWPQGSLFEFIQGSSPLHIACVLENESIVEDLLKENPKMNIRKKDGATPLFIACELGNEDIVRLLLEKKADIKITRKDGASPLSVATDFELTNEADINIKGQYEVTPLLLACLNNEDSTVHLLLLHKANTDCCLRDQCSNPNESKIVDWLETTFPSFVKKYRQLWPQGSLFEFIQGSSPLHIACVLENESIVEDLLKENPKMNIRKKDGATPIFIACELGNTDIVRLLLDKKADIEITRKDGASPLSVATDSEVHDMILNSKERNAITSIP